jgi:hypothetical protein
MTPKQCFPGPLRLLSVLIVSGIISAPIHAVRLDGDGRGHALIYPYYTARSTSGGNAFVTAFAVFNTSDMPKAVKVRFLEGKTGAQVMDFNLFLSAYDVWTAGVLASGTGAAIFSKDKSCTAPVVSSDASNPTRFQASYAGDGFGDSLDRTLEGYFEMVEMGAIDPASDLGRAVTHRADFNSTNASIPSCVGLPSTDEQAAGLSRPAGGLAGSASYINVNEGTDFSVDAVVLSQWSDKAQWSAAGNPRPAIADASPPVSTVTQSRGEGDVMVVSRWNTGRDAVSAVLMAERIANEYSVESNIKAATDWIVTLPTKRFHVTGTVAEPPFIHQPVLISPQATLRTEPSDFEYYDREELSPGACISPPCPSFLAFTSSTIAFTRNAGLASVGTVLGGTNLNPFGMAALNALWINGWATLNLSVDPRHALVAPAGSSKIVDTLTGDVVSTGAAVTYFGLPVVGFAVQSYSTTGLPGVNPNVLSNYGGSFGHKYTRRISASQ